MSFRTSLLLFGILWVQACGFQPLYGRYDNVVAADEFLKIEIGSVKDRIGQQFRNELVRQLHGDSSGSAPVYRLSTVLSESQTSLAVQKSAFATRANLTVTAAFTLTRVSDNNSVFSSKGRSVVSFNILDSEFASSLAERNARDRAVRELAADIRLRLGSYFDGVRKGIVIKR